MELLYKIRDGAWQRRLVGLLVVGLLASQLLGIAHASDLDMHHGDAPCDICKVVERGGTLPPTSSVAPLPITVSSSSPNRSSVALVAVIRETRPPTRAPPQ